MQITIPIGPLSVNKSSKGNHHKSKDYLQFEKDVCLLLPFNKEKPLDGEYFVIYRFHLKNYGLADEDNCIKLIQDILVQRGYFKDDRYIKAKYSIKERVKTYAEEKIEVDIKIFTEDNRM